MTVTPLGATIGAELSDLKLGSPLAGDDVAALRRALVEHKVLVARGQHLTVDELVVAGSHLGPLTRGHPVLPPIDAEHPQVMEIDTTRSRTDPRYRDEYENDTWHTDVSFMPDPPFGSLLSGVVIPPLGGDTAFIDAQAAYASLSEPVRSFIDRLEAEHDGSTEFAAFLARSPEGGTWGGRPFRELAPVVHPVVRVHPESGHRSLFVNPTFTTRIVGVSKLESARLLAMLYEHAAIAEHVFRHRWQEGDVVIWDNRSTMHMGVRDYGEQHRVLHRVTIAGDVPVGVSA